MFVTLLGRSNVGKSSLFNALVSNNVRLSNVMKSVVSDHPGTTRNAKHGDVSIKGKRITLVDTGGIESMFSTVQPNETGKAGKIITHIEGETIRAVKRSDLILFVVDGKEGITPLDTKMACKIKEWFGNPSRGFNVNLIVNKLDREGSAEYYETLSECVSDCYSLQLGEPLFISAYDPGSIQKLRELICKRLNISRTSETLSLEELALVADSIPDVYATSDEVFDENAIKLIEDAEVDKSMRVCSSVRGSFIPNDRWIRLLNNVCDTAPFAVRNEKNYIIPSMLSPSEQLAKMYISKATCAADNSGITDKPPEKPTVQSSQDTSEIAKNKVQQNIPPCIRPIRIVLLGSVGGFQTTLAKVLSDSELDTRIEPDYLSESLSPNWHKLYGEWTRVIVNEEVTQPVEIYSAAALNLGGSLGNLASLQTRHLTRKADVIVMCSKCSNEHQPWKVRLTKKEASWMSKIIRLHKPILVAVEERSKPMQQKMTLDLEHVGHEFDAVPILSVHIPPNTVSADNNAPLPSDDISKSIRHLRRNIMSLIDRGYKVIDTSTLNQWLRAFLSKWPPPWHEGAKVNVKFAAQVRGAPPTFVMWSNVYGSFPQHYLRQMKKALSVEFGFQGIPLKFVMRTTAEPKSMERRKVISWKRKLHGV